MVTSSMEEYLHASSDNIKNLTTQDLSFLYKTFKITTFHNNYNIIVAGLNHWRLIFEPATITLLEDIYNT